MTLVCGICLYVKKGIANDAITVINGQAVCEDHMEYAQSELGISRIIGTIRLDQRRRGAEGDVTS